MYTSGTLHFIHSFPTRRSSDLPIINDDLQEAAENFTVLLHDPVGTNITDNTGLGTINNKHVHSVTINNVSVAESADNATFVVSTGVRVQADTTVTFSTSNGGIL